MNNKSHIWQRYERQECYCPNCLNAATLVASLNDTSKVNKQHKYWTLILLLTLGITLFMEFVFRLLRIVSSIGEYHIGLLEFIFTAILLPFYLVTIHSYINKKLSTVGHYGIYTFVVFVCILVSARLNFINWWDTIGHRTNAETRDVIEIGFTLEFIIGVIISESALCLALYIRNQRRKIKVV